jgi:hypothetical protein
LQLTATVVEMAGARVGLSMLATRVMLRDGMTIDGGMRWRWLAGRVALNGAPQWAGFEIRKGRL